MPILLRAPLLLQLLACLGALLLVSTPVKSTSAPTATCPPVPGGCPKAHDPVSPITFAPVPCTSPTHGTCLYGACLCNPGWIGMDCATPQRPLVLGDLVLTQEALLDAPNRYSQVITSTFNSTLATLTALPAYQYIDCNYTIARTQSVPISQITFTLNEPSVSFSILDVGIRVAATFSILIPHIPLDVYVATSPGVPPGCCISNNPASPDFAVTGTCTSACVASNGDHAAVNFNITLQAIIVPTILPNGTVTAVVPNNTLTTSLSPANLGLTTSCNLNAYTLLLYTLVNDYVSPFGVLLAQQLQTALAAEVTSLANTLTFSQTYPLTSTLTLVFQVTQITMVHEKVLIASLQGNVIKQRFNGSPACPAVYSSFVDTSVDSNLTVPSDWLTYPGLGETQGTNVLALTAGFRATRSFVSALVWGAFTDDPSAVVSVTYTNTTIQILDAKILFEAFWKFPAFGFTPQGDISIVVSSGSVDMVCSELDDLLVSGLFGTIQLAMGLNLVWNGTSYAVAPNLISANTDNVNLDFFQPFFPVPNAISSQVASALLAQYTPTLNAYLLSNALTLPPSFTEVLPSPRIEAFSILPQTTDGYSGFLQMSSHCLCNAPANGDTYIETSFGEERFTLCTKPCAASVYAAAQLHVHNAPNTQGRRRAAHIQQPQRRTLSDFSANMASSACSNNNYTTLANAVGIIYQCLNQNTISAAFSPSAEWYQCMTQSKYAAYSQGACTLVNGPFSAVAQCQATLTEIYTDLFNSPCTISGSAVTLESQCSATFSAVFDQMCSCASDPSQLVCQGSQLPFTLLYAGLGFPYGFFLLLFFVVAIFPSRGYRRAFFTRTKWRSRDKFLVVVLIITVLGLYFMTFVWVFNDPFRIWTNQILNQPIMQSNWVISSTLSTFMISWSLTGLFAVSASASSATVVAIWSIFSGRAIWLHPSNTLYLRNGKTVFLEPDESRLHSRVANIWINVLRFQVVFIVCILFAPPFFFSFINSVSVFPPGYISTFASNSSDSAALKNYTGYTTDDLFGEASYLLGLSILAQAMGFLSSGFLFMMHGASPGFILAAQTVLILVNWREEAEKREYQRYENLLPPPDNSELVNIKRVMLLFQWSIHAVAAVSTMISVVMLYQTLNAGVLWVVSWMLCWVLPVPLLIINSSSTLKSCIPTPYHVVFFLYALFFGSFTWILVIFNPPAAGFSILFAAATIFVSVTISYLIILSELINVDSRSNLALKPKTREDRDRRKRLLAHMGLDADLVPALLEQDLDLSTWSPAMAAKAQKLMKSPLVRQDSKGSAYSGLARQDSIGSAYSNSTSKTTPNRGYGNTKDGLPPLDLNSENPLYAAPSPSPQSPPMRPPRTHRIAQTYQRAVREEDMPVDALAAAARRVNERTTARIARDSMRMEELTKLPTAPGKSVAATASIASSSKPTMSQVTNSAPVVPARNYDNNTIRTVREQHQQTQEIADNFAGFERYKIARDVERRLAARGVTGAAVAGLVARIVDFEMARAAALEASKATVKFQPVRPLRRDQVTPLRSATDNDMNKLKAAAAPTRPPRRDLSPSPSLSTARVVDDNAAVWKPPPAVQQRQRDLRSQLKIQQLRAERLAMDVQQHGLSEYTLSRVLSALSALKPFYAIFYDFIWEIRENRDPRIYGLRYPWRRQLFFIGILFAWIVHTHASYYVATVENLKEEIFRGIFTSNFPVPIASNLTSVLDLALSDYAYQYNQQFTLGWAVLGLFTAAFFAEIFYSRLAAEENKKFGLILSRVFIFSTVPLMFTMVIMRPSPNYFADILTGLTGTPKCAPQLDATIENILSQGLGLFMGSYLTAQLFFVLLLGVPGLMHGAYFVTWRENRKLKQLDLLEPSDDFRIAQKRASNARLVFRLYPWLNPTLTFIPTVMICQFLPGRTYVPFVILVFWAWPALMVQYGKNSSTEHIFFWGYFAFWVLFCITYFIPMTIILILEGGRLGFVNYIISWTFRYPYWYLNSIAESFLIVIVLCDILYLFLANNDKDVGDLLIDDYLKAVQNEAQFEANLPLLNSQWPSHTPGGLNSQWPSQTPGGLKLNSKMKSPGNSFPQV